MRFSRGNDGRFRVTTYHAEASARDDSLKAAREQFEAMIVRGERRQDVRIPRDERFHLIHSTMFRRVSFI
jgi:hypothetical protein